MPDPIRPISSQPLDSSLTGTASEGEAMCVPPKPEKCEAPPNRSLTPPAPPASAEPSPSPRAVDLLVSRARRPSAADSPSDRAGSRPLSSQADAGVTQSGDRFADVAVRRGVTARGDTVEFMCANAQGGGHNEVSVTGLRLQSRDGKAAASSELFTAKATVSTRMLPGCEGPHVAAGVTAAQSEFSYRANAAEETSLAVSAGAGFEAGMCVRDKDGDGVPEVCIRVGAGPFTLTDCSEPQTSTSEDSDRETGGGPSQSTRRPPANLGSGGAPGY